MAKEITLSRGPVALVDDEDFQLLDQYYWQVRPDGATAYAIDKLSRKPGGLIFMSNRQKRPKGRGGIGKVITMHRILLAAPGNQDS